MLELNRDNFDIEVLQAVVPVLVEFWAPWCGSCRQVKPLVEDVATRFVGVAKVGRADMAILPDIARKCGVFTPPAFVVFKGGEAVMSWSCMPGKNTLAKKLKQALGDPSSRL